MEGDDELAAIRQKRMQELQQQAGGADGQKNEERRQKQADMVNSILSQILDQNARARLNSIALVKPEKAKRVEAMLIQMAQGGQISEKMNEARLVDLLEKISGSQTKTKVKFERRRVMDSDSD